MFDFDVVFLALMSIQSTRVDEMRRLHDIAAGAGMHTAVATHPADLATVSRRLRVIVIDGDRDSDFDVHAVTAKMRGLRNVAIVFLADSIPMACQRGLEAGADICLPARTGSDDFCSALIRLAEDKLHAAPDNICFVGKADARKKERPLKTASMPTELCWTLIDHGWVLCTPQGIGLSLTATERDLMTNFFTADDKTVSHAQWERRYGRYPLSRLPILVYRLRHKCAMLDIPLPIHGRHGIGYRFSEACRIVQDQ